MKKTLLIPAASLLVLSIFSIVRADDFNRTVINCSSRGYAYTTCYAGQDIESVRLMNQESRSPCIAGNTWGYTHDSVWVNQGCRANFEVITRDNDRHEGGDHGDHGDHGGYGRGGDEGRGGEGDHGGYGRGGEGDHGGYGRGGEGDHGGYGRGGEGDHGGYGRGGDEGRGGEGRR